MNTQTIILSIVAGVVAIASTVSLAFDLFLKDRNRIKRRFDEEFNRDLPDRIRRSALFKDLQGNGQASGTLNRLSRPLKDLLEQSGMSWSIQGVLIRSVLGGGILATISALFSGHWFAITAGLLAGAAYPILQLLSCRGRRRAKLSGQLPDAFELMVRVIRAGQTVSAAFQIVAREAHSPLADEFAFCAEQQNLGLSPEVALRDLARRNDIMEFQLFAVAMLVQRQSGGNPVEVLGNLAAVSRKRMRLAARVKSLTSEGRLQAIVLMALPLIAFIALLFLNPNYTQTLLDRPKLLVGIAVSQVVGMIWLRQVVKIEY